MTDPFTPQRLGRTLSEKLTAYRAAMEARQIAYVAWLAASQHATQSRVDVSIAVDACRSALDAIALEVAPPATTAAKADDTPRGIRLRDEPQHEGETT